MSFAFVGNLLWPKVRRHRALALLLVAIAGSWGLFFVVAHELREDRLQADHGFPFDRPVLDFLHQHPTPGICALATQLSNLAGPVWLAAYALTALGGAWLVHQRRYYALGFGVGAIGGTMAINLLAKYYFDRLRPDFYYEVCFGPLHRLTDPSFPSGHTMASLALAGTVGILSMRTPWRWVVWGGGLLVALSVAWSRLYLAEHYPSDILASWLATTAWVGSLYLVTLRYQPARRRLWARCRARRLPTVR